MTPRITLVICAVAAALAGCAGNPRPADLSSGARGGVTLIRPRCAGVGSCLLGQVVAAESGGPMSRAAVFLELEESAERRIADPAGPLRFLALTDDQGVFTVENAPRGRYRLAVYKDARHVEARGIELGAPGTTVVPVRLPPG